jgi:hypothetical protein
MYSILIFYSECHCGALYLAQKKIVLGEKILRDLFALIEKLIRQGCVSRQSKFRCCMYGFEKRRGNNPPMKINKYVFL